MKIVDLAPEHESLYFNCLIGDPDRLADAGDYKRVWYEAMKPRGLKVKLALDDRGNPVGMIQYLPVEESSVAGRDLYSLLCIWVINDKKFRGNHQRHGYGKALLAAMEDDARQHGKKGVTVWGLSLPAFMPAAWFKKHGYAEAERQGMRVLLWKHWDPTAQKPFWVRRHKTPENRPGRVTVTAFCSGWCPEVNKAFTRTKRAVAGCGGPIEFAEINTTERKTFEEWGIVDGLFVDGKEMPLGPAPSYAKIKRAIGKSVKNAQRGHHA
jgi:GNAT superfamily N-acetyltransferase